MMFRTLALTAATALGLVAAAPALAEPGGSTIYNYDFAHDGPFGSYDENQLQRGLQIYQEVCAACHGLKYVAFRTLSDEGGPNLPQDQMRAFAEFYEVWDPTLFDGEGDFRTATPADKFPAVTAANAPDLSLMAKARAGFSGPYGTGIAQLLNGLGGPEYIASLLEGYKEEPECAAEADLSGFYYNTVFAAGAYPDSCKDENGENLYPGSWIAMAPPLYGEDVEFADGAENDLYNEAMDVASFLMWTAEPKLVARKQAGLTGVIFLTILSVLLYLTNKRIWAPHKKAVKKG